VILEVTPVSADGDRIDLALKPSVTEFEGFVNFGGSRDAKANLDGDALADTYRAGTGAAGVINQPIFSTRVISTQVTLDSGQSILVGGIHGKALDFVDAIDFPGKSDAKKSRRQLFIFVTATLIDSRGRPMGKNVTPAPAAPAAALAADSKPFGVPVPGMPGFITSPLKPDAGYIDVRGFPASTEVKDPYSRKIILVPPMPAATPAPTAAPKQHP